MSDDKYTMEDPYAKDAPTPAAAVTVMDEGPKKKNGLKVAIIVILCVVVLGVAGFFAWQALRPVDISAYADQEITLTGITEDPIVLTVADIAEMDCVEMTADGAGRENSRQKTKKGEIAVYGPTLDTLLAPYGVSKDDFASIKFIGGNGYDNTLKADQLDQEVICSIAEGKEALYRDYRPLYVILPDDGTDTWCYNVVAMEFTRAGEEPAADEAEAASADAAAETEGASA